MSFSSSLNNVCYISICKALNVLHWVYPWLDLIDTTGVMEELVTYSFLVVYPIKRVSGWSMSVYFLKEPVLLHSLSFFIDFKACLKTCTFCILSIFFLITTPPDVTENVFHGSKQLKGLTATTKKLLSHFNVSQIMDYKMYGLSIIPSTINIHWILRIQYSCNWKLWTSLTAKLLGYFMVLVSMDSFYIAKQNQLKCSTVLKKYCITRLY